MNLMIFLGYISSATPAAYVFSFSGIAIGVYLISLGIKSAAARNHGIIVAAMNVFAFLLLFFAI
jgi:hypothetical protein